VAELCYRLSGTRLDAVGRRHNQVTVCDRSRSRTCNAGDDQHTAADTDGTPASCTSHDVPKGLEVPVCGGAPKKTQDATSAAQTCDNLTDLA
jgi:hypothetical protein